MTTKNNTNNQYMTGGRALMEALVREGVTDIFGYPGGAIMPIYDELYHYQNKIRHILVRHEQGATHAAEGYAHCTGKTGVVFATSGPGATNLVTGIADAMIDSRPLVCITGQVTASLLGTDAFQEVDVIGITTPITKWNYQITNAQEIPEVIAKAFYISGTGRPGPVVIDITKNAQFEQCKFNYPDTVHIPSYQPHVLPHAKQIEAAAALINNASKPYILFGHGVQISQAQNELEDFVNKTGIPAASTLLGLSSLPTSHSLFVGMLGMHGNYGANYLTNKADVIIAIGMRFDDRVTGRLSSYAKQAKIIHIDIDPAELNKIVYVDVPIVADIKEALLALLPKVKKKTYPLWTKEFNQADTIEFEKVIRDEIAPREDGSMTMGRVVHLISEKTHGKAVIVADVGQHQMISARYYRFTETNNFITSGGLGTMGFSLPAAIGAKVAEPEKEVIALIGDGSFQMTIQELATIAQEQLPVKIVILNNHFLGMVRQWQQLFFDNRYSFVDLKNPDFVSVAKGFYIDGERVVSEDQLSGAIERMLQAEKPYLLDIHVKKEINIFPMIAPGASVEEIRLE